MGDPFSHSSQCSLGLELPEDIHFDHFIGEENQHILDALMRLLKSKGDNFIFLHGARGSGKTYLLQATCQHALDLSLSAIYFSLRDVADNIECLFENMEQLTLVCIDDIDVLQANRALEEPLFHLFNRIKTNLGKLVIGSGIPLKALSLSLPDLYSRLHWGLSLDIKALSDDELIDVLKLNAHSAGLGLSHEVCQFLFKRVPRDIASLQHIFQKLNEASFIEKRRLTVPFVKEVLKI